MKLKLTIPVKYVPEGWGCEWLGAHSVVKNINRSADEYDLVPKGCATVILPGTSTVTVEREPADLIQLLHEISWKAN